MMNPSFSIPARFAVEMLARLKYEKFDIKYKTKNFFRKNKVKK